MLIFFSPSSFSPFPPPYPLLSPSSSLLSLRLSLPLQDTKKAGCGSWCSWSLWCLHGWRRCWPLRCLYWSRRWGWPLRGLHWWRWGELQSQLLGLECKWSLIGRDLLIGRQIGGFVMYSELCLSSTLTPIRVPWFKIHNTENKDVPLSGYQGSRFEVQRIKMAWVQGFQSRRERCVVFHNPVKPWNIPHGSLAPT